MALCVWLIARKAASTNPMFIWRDEQAPAAESPRAQEASKGTGSDVTRQRDVCVTGKLRVCVHSGKVAQRGKLKERERKNKSNSRVNPMAN